MQTLQAILLLIIAGLGSWIAYQQMLAARVKLQHDLFDRRYAVFQSTRDFIVYIIQHGGPSLESYTPFHQGTSDALFFFDTDVTNYIREINSRAIDLDSAKETLRTPNQTEEERKNLLGISHENRLWFSKQLPVLSQKFERYMKIPVLRPL